MRQFAAMTDQTSTGLSLRTAAKAVGLDKTTILRAIQSGKISADKNQNGGWVIQPAELFRVYKPASAPVDAAVATDAVRHDALPPVMQDAAAAPAVSAEKVAGLEAQVKILRELVEELKSQRDGWQQQAERLSLNSPSQPPAKKGLWHRLVG